MLVIGGSLLIALCAQLSFYLPVSPVPVTMQTFAVILTGALLGSKRGVMSIAAYLTEGALGLPVFAGGKMGLVILMGPTGGYLLGFLAAAFLTGYLAERGWDRKYWTMALAMTLGTALIFIFGLAWLSIVLTDAPVLKIGLYPFIPGAILKIGMATLLLPTGWKLLKKTKKIS
jgi:biotin transport system substrate-specific component